MSLEKPLSVQKRSALGKGFNRRLREDSGIPGVFYNAQGDNIPVQVSTLPMEKMYSSVGRTTVFQLEIDDNGNKSTHPVMIWQVQYHPYKKAFTHIDFYGVDLEKPVKVMVNIEFTGTAKGVKLGGRLETYRERVSLISKPLDMPKKVVVDVTELSINNTVRVEDLVLPEGVTASYDKNFAIVSVISKAAETEEDGQTI